MVTWQPAKRGADEEAKAEPEAETNEEAEAEPALCREMDISDNSRRTPIMLVLRNDTSFGEEGDAYRKTDMEKTFNLLYTAMKHGGKQPGVEWMRPTRIRSPVRDIPCKAVTELMHAARGGLASLELALHKEGSKQRVRRWLPNDRP